MKRLPSPSMVVAVVALVVSLSGTGYAAVTLARNSVGTQQLRTGAVTSSDIRDRAVRSRDLAPEVRRALGATGPAGTVGPAGATGPSGAAGPGGAVGPQGGDGARGGDGTPGAPGAAGVPGPKGEPGVTGPAGPQGERGPEGPATGPAGGDLDGRYPAPRLRAGAVTAGAIGTLPAVRVEQRTAQTFASAAAASAFTNVVFQDEDYDTDAMFDPSTPDRITIRTPGVYALSGAVRWNPNATGARAAGLVPDTVSIAFLAADTRPAAPAGHATRQSVATTARLTAGTVVVLKALQDSGAALDLNNNGSPQVHLAATWLAP